MFISTTRRTLNFSAAFPSQEGTNAPAMFTYLPQTPSPANHFAVMRCMVNDPVGNVTECFFDARNRCVMERDYTGRATPGLPVTDTDNRPTGKLRSSDPDYYETRGPGTTIRSARWKPLPAASRCSAFINPISTRATPARKRADCRVVRELATAAVDLDGDGVADVTDRTWRFEYDPRFGSESDERARPRNSMSAICHLRRQRFLAASESIIV